MARLLGYLMFPIVCLPLGACPIDFQELTGTLSADLHHYVNRSYTRLNIRTQAQAVSLPDREPLPIREPDPSVRQVFLTINQRRSGELRTTDQAYWLFMVSTPKNWKLAMVFTRVGNAPPIDVSNGAVADAVRTWLRDRCG